MVAQVCVVERSCLGASEETEARETKGCSALHAAMLPSRMSERVIVLASPRVIWCVTLEKGLGVTMQRSYRMPTEIDPPKRHLAKPVLRSIFKE